MDIFPYVRRETQGRDAEVSVECWKAIQGRLKVVPEGPKVVLEGLKALQGRLIQEAGRLGEPARG